MTTQDARHPLADLDETVHQRARLGILAILNEAKEADFTHLKTALALTDGNLGRHLEVLADAGHVTVRKKSDGRRNRTWVRITATGRRAQRAEVEMLRQLQAATEGQPPDPGGRVAGGTDRSP